MTVQLIPRSLLTASIALICLAPLCAGGQTHPVRTSHCVLHRDGSRFVGSCGPLFDQTPTLTLAPAKAITTGRWRENAEPASVWAGDITEEGSENEPLELEIYAGGSGVLRTMYGWFAASHIAEAEGLSFELDSTKEVRPNAVDEKIVRRAAAILSSEKVWNRADDRNCPAAAKTWSIYCAMEKATIEVSGGFHHRRPALQFVREIVDKRTAGRRYHHRLMDYNNDPTTRLSDVQSLFQEALQRMQDKGK